MTTVIEQKLRVDFDPAAWAVLKWDDHALYRHGIGKLNGQRADSVTGTLVPEGTNAIDIIALDAHALHLIEIKDFRNFGPQNAHRQEHELPLEIGLKVRDTLAGLLGAYALGRQLDVIAPFVRVLLERQLPIRVIAWLAEDAPPRLTPGRRASRSPARGEINSLGVSSGSRDTYGSTIRSDLTWSSLASRCNRPTQARAP